MHHRKAEICTVILIYWNKQKFYLNAQKPYGNCSSPDILNTWYQRITLMVTETTGVYPKISYTIENKEKVQILSTACSPCIRKNYYFM